MKPNKILTAFSFRSKIPLERCVENAIMQESEKHQRVNNQSEKPHDVLPGKRWEEVVGEDLSRCSHILKVHSEFLELQVTQVTQFRVKLQVYLF